MTEEKKDMDLNDLVCQYVNPHTGREHTALIIKERQDDTVNLVHFDPDTGLMQVRFAVPYSLALQANTFHWFEDDNQPKTAEEKAAVALATVTSVQTLNHVAPLQGVAATSTPAPNQSVPPAKGVVGDSVELEQSDAPAVAPVPQAIPPTAPDLPTTEPTIDNPNPPMTIQQAETKVESDQHEQEPNQ